MGTPSFLTWLTRLPRTSSGEWVHVLKALASGCKENSPSPRPWPLTVQLAHTKAPFLSSGLIPSWPRAPGSSVWYGAALRGDVNSITVGSNSHIGDRTVVHVASEAGSVKGKAVNTSIGDGVSIGPLSVIHACTVANGAA